MLRGMRLRKKPTRAQMEEEQQRTGGAVYPANYANILRGQRQAPPQDDTELEFEELDPEGVVFRRVLFGLFLVVVLLLLFLKWDRETMVPPNEAALEKRGAAAAEAEAAATEGAPAGDETYDKYFSMLNVNKDEKNRAKRVQEQFEKMSQELDPTKNPECGDDCSNKLVELKNAYNALATYVANPYHKVLNIPRNAGMHKIKKAYEKAKAEAERGESKYELAEIKEAYDIMTHPEARAYYSLYGTKPPESLKHQQKNTHGGWGVEFGMGTFKYAILRAWLDYFDNGWVELGFFGTVFIVLGVKVWNTKDELMAKLEQMEMMEKLMEQPDED